MSSSKAINVGTIYTSASLIIFSEFSTSNWLSDGKHIVHEEGANRKKRRYEAPARSTKRLSTSVHTAMEFISSQKELYAELSTEYEELGNLYDKK
jgi:hypothetical protein